MTGRWSGSLRGVSAFLLAGALFTGAAITAFAQAQSYNVTLRNFAIDGAPAQVRAGAPITFNATASGLPHNLAIEGSGVMIPAPGPNLTDGQSGAITFAALQPGTYTLYCPVGMHRANGMQTTMTVVAASTLPATGGAAGAAVPAGLALAGLGSAAAGLFLRRRGA
jgi:plastocyanin